MEKGNRKICAMLGCNTKSRWNSETVSVNGEVGQKRIHTLLVRETVTFGGADGKNLAGENESPVTMLESPLCPAGKEAKSV